MQQSLLSVRYLDWLFRLSLQTTSTLLCHSWAVRRRKVLVTTVWCLLVLNWFEPGNLTLPVSWWLYRNGVCVSQHGDVRMERGCNLSLSVWQLLTRPHTLFQEAADHSEARPTQRLSGFFNLREAITHCSREVLGCFLFLHIGFEINNHCEVKVDFPVQRPKLNLYSQWWTMSDM